MEHGSNDFLFIIFIAVAIGIAWLISPAPSSSTNNGGSSRSGLFSYLVPAGLGTQPGRGDTSGGQTISQAGGGGNAEGSANATPVVAKLIFDRSNSSPSATSPDSEHVTIMASGDNTAPVSLTGWKLTSPVSGVSYSLPEGVRLFLSGQVGTPAPVVLQPNDRAVITTGRSPIGESFLTNECSGYLSQFQNFNPGLNRNCPLPSSELAYSIDNSRTYSDACFDYLNNMPRCSIAQAGTIPVGLPPICQNFIATRMTYNGCVDAHKNDAQFYGNDWRLYLNRTSEIWRQNREEIDLVNPNGVIVDSYSY